MTTPSIQKSVEEIARHIMHVSETEDYSPPYRVLPEPPISCKWIDFKIERIKEALTAERSEIARLKVLLDTAHKVFARDCDGTEKEVARLEAELERLKTTEQDRLKHDCGILMEENKFLQAVLKKCKKVMTDVDKVCRCHQGLKDPFENDWKWLYRVQDVINQLTHHEGGKK